MNPNLMVRTFNLWHIPDVESGADVVTFEVKIIPPLLSKCPYVASDPVTVSTYGASGQHVSPALAPFSIITVSPATDSDSVPLLAFEFPPVSPSEFTHAPIVDPRASEFAEKFTVKENKTFLIPNFGLCSIFGHLNISLFAIDVNECLTQNNLPLLK